MKEEITVKVNADVDELVEKLKQIKKLLDEINNININISTEVIPNKPKIMIADKEII